MKNMSRQKLKNFLVLFSSLELNENGYKTYPNLWNTLKAGKFIALIASIKRKTKTNEQKTGEISY